MNAALRRAWAALAFATGAAAAFAQPLPTQEVAAGVFVHRGAQLPWGAESAALAGDVANLGFIVGSRCVAVIDSGGSPEVGRRLQATVAQVTPLPVCLVVTTHAHPDHALGASAFAAATPPPAFAAHARFGPAFAARVSAFANAMQRDLQRTLPPEAVVYPTLAVTKQTEFDLGERTLLLRAWPTSHTDNDLTVYDRRTRTLFTGDLVFAGHLPVLDGKLAGWLATLGELQALDVALAVPGHGEPSRDWAALLAPEREYLLSLQREVRAALRAHRTLAQAVESITPPAGSRWLLAEHFHRRNVTAAYAELEWEE